MTEVDRLGEVAEDRGWRALVVDLDDTLGRSNKLWMAGFGYFGDRVGEMVGVEGKTVAKRLAEINNEVYAQLGVHPRKYGVMAQRIAAEFGGDEKRVREEMKSAVMMIYYNAPELEDGARWTVEKVREAGMEVVVATHSPLGRAKLVMRRWGWEDIPMVVQSTLGPKDEKIFLEALRVVKVKPEQAISVGDSIIGDIESAGKAGIRDRVLVKPKWKVFAEGKLPEGVPTISGIGQLVGTMIDYFGRLR